VADLITSSANPVVKRVRLLADRRHRRREGAFVVQGIQPVWQAVEAGAAIETLIVAPGLLGRSPAARRAAEMVAGQEAAGVRVARLSDELFGRLSGRDGPPGLAAIVRGRVLPLSELPSGPRSVFVALHEIGNPGNLGTIIRTANAAGAGGVVLIGQATDPFDPVAVKASMGALFGLPVAQAREAGEFFAWAAGRGVTVITTSARAPRGRGCPGRCWRGATWRCASPWWAPPSRSTWRWRPACCSTRRSAGPAWARPETGVRPRGEPRPGGIGPGLSP